MPDHDLSDLGELERDVLRHVWRLGTATADKIRSELSRPLKDGFRMQGHLDSATLEKVYLPADGITIAFRASGELKILYGM